jgi:ribulose-5-phosphate 4-epimerase/fuculose-1-phosphate aldolase
MRIDAKLDSMARPASQWPSAALAASDVEQLRIDLAAAFRLAVEFDWHEAVANHFSAAVSADGRKFLLNPRWRHFALIEPADLLLLDADDADTMQRPNAPDPSAWCIHGTIHRQVPEARVLLHCHPPYATALAALKDPRILPIDQNTAFFYGRVAIDRGYGGLADDAEEGERLAAAIAGHEVLLMGNHGVTVVGATVAQAFDLLYYFERACKTLMLAYASGQPLNVMTDAIAEKTARDWEAYRGSAFAHFDQLKRLLARKEKAKIP